LAHHTHAVLHGDEETAALLVRLGAAPQALTGAQAFQAAVLRLDRGAARDLAARHPEVLASPAALLTAAAIGRTEAVALLLDLGTPPDLAEPDGRRALHNAASCGAIETARLLIAAGADVDARGTQYDATALSFAHFHDQAAMVDELAPFSRDVFTLALAAKIQRLAEVLEAEPALANARRRNGRTPLFDLPDDEDAAAAVTRLLLAYGADPRLTNAEGLTPERAARDRGLDEAAELMRGG
jgi:hypothetical protein